MASTNRISPFTCPPSPCDAVFDPKHIEANYRGLLSDESRIEAEEVEALYLPKTIPEVVWAMHDLNRRGLTCVVSAGRTGIAGGAVPKEGGAILSLAAMRNPLAIRRCGEEYTIRVEPGLTLAQLTGLLMNGDYAKLAAPSEADKQVAAELARSGNKLWFPVNPTETSAHIGGIVATNASGARSFRYGPTRQWVRGLSVVLADGRVLTFRRGEVRAESGQFLLENSDGNFSTLRLESLRWPETKATLGFPLADDMDLIDLFIGSEGSLGVICEVELALAKKPSSTVGVLAVAADENMALELVDAARSKEDLTLDAIEYFDHDALQLLQARKSDDGPASQLPELPRWDGCGVYFELAGSDEETEAGCELLEEVLNAVGMSIDDTWAAMEPSEMAAQRLFRHTVPEVVNSLIGRYRQSCPGLHKVGTDMAVPDDQLAPLFAMYRSGLVALGIESVIFGHIGDNHVHVNLLPKTMEELAQAKELYQNWAKEVVSMGGAVAAEHGIGRLKKSLLACQYSEKELNMMRHVRRFFDPNGILAPGVLID